MIPFVSTRKYHYELNRIKLREEILRSMVLTALRDLNRARIATEPVKDCVEPVIKLLRKALTDTDLI